MKQENDIPDKIMERIRKLIRLKESTTSEGEANNAAILVNRLLREYNLSLLDINERQPEEKFQIRRSDRLSFKDTFGSYWSVICFVSCANIITAGCLFIKEPQT